MLIKHELKTFIKQHIRHGYELTRKQLISIFYSLKADGEI